MIAAAVAKGRSSSHSLLRLSSLCVAGGLQLANGYVGTHDNPADLPSRWAKGRVIRLKKGDKNAGDKGQIQQAAMSALRFWKNSGTMPSTWDEFDVATGQWLENIVAEGYPKGYASDGLAALQHYVPEVAGKVRHSWRLLKSWQKMEPPVRVLPISPLMAVAIVELAPTFLLSFDTFLRPGELYRLTKQDITWAGSLAVLSLKKTKSGQRRNDGGICHSRTANIWLWKALQHKKPQDLLLDETPSQLRPLFFHLLEHLEVPGHFSLYSFRRGGATWHFLSQDNIEQTL